MHPFIKKAIELEALKFGDFTLKSGLKSKYFFNIASFFNGQDMHFLASQYFKVIQKANLEFDAMYGPAYKGIPLATAISQLFYVEEQKKIELIFDRKEIKNLDPFLVEFHHISFFAHCHGAANGLQSCSFQ